MAVVPKQLTPFKKGISGNPKGKPKGTISITTAVRNKLREAGKDGKTNLDRVAEVIMEKAIKEKDHATLKTMWEYMDGKALQKTDIMSGGEKIAAVMEINYLQPEIKEVKEIKKLSPAK